MICFFPLFSFSDEATQRSEDARAKYISLYNNLSQFAFCVGDCPGVTPLIPQCCNSNRFKSFLAKPNASILSKDTKTSILAHLGPFLPFLGHISGKSPKSSYSSCFFHGVHGPLSSCKKSAQADKRFLRYQIWEKSGKSGHSRGTSGCLTGNIIFVNFFHNPLSSCKKSARTDKQFLRYKNGVKCQFYPIFSP